MCDPGNVSRPTAADNGIGADIGAGQRHTHSKFSNISNSFSPALFAAENAASNSAATQKIQLPANDSADTVKLSESQQVVQLYQQGQQVSQIASSLSLTVETVNSYLGISGAQ
jgi:DNA-binding NarL/FixJ family response regulator